MAKSSYEHCPSEVPFLGETIGDCLERTARERPNGEALVSRHEGIRLSHAEMLKLVDRLAHGLLASGIEIRDRVAVWSTNNHAWVLAQYATARVGAILVNINPAFRLHELEHVLKASRTRMLLLGDGFRDASYPELLLELCPEMADATPGELSCAALPELRSAVYIGDDAPPGMITLAALNARGDAAAAASPGGLTDRAARLDFDDDINIQYTSGTTGLPKGVTLSHHNILNNAYFVGRIMGLGPDDRLFFCVAVPFYHCFGMVLGTLTCLTSSACLVLPSPWFDAGEVLATVEAERCTALHGVPTMFIAELSHPEFARFDLSTLRTGIMAGAPCPINVVHDVMERMNMREVLIGYGQTEVSPIATMTRPDDPPEKRAETVGRTTPHQELKIMDPVTGATLPRGATGEICFRGYHLMARYDNDPMATAETVDANGWLHSGDLGTMDDKGYVTIAGRIKEMVIRGGENIYPREIEEFLHTLDIVLDACVVGVPDPKYGEELVAWVRLRPGVEPPTVEEFRQRCKGMIAGCKIPRYWKVVDEFPMTVTGKVQKYRVREQAIRDLGHQDIVDLATFSGHQGI